MLADRQERLLDLALHCYPDQWRARHGAEAAELAALLAQDGVPLRATAWSYFKGAGAALAVLDRSHMAVLWQVGGQEHCSTAAPGAWYQLTGGLAVSGRAICLKAASSAQTTSSAG